MNNEEFAKRFVRLVETAENYTPLSAGAKERAMSMTTASLKSQGRQKTRRLVYTMACLMIIGLIAGGILIKPGDPNKQAARSLLISAANAMEGVESISFKYRFTPDPRNKWDPLPAGSSYIYASPQELYMWVWDKDGKPQTAEGVNLQASQWWFYAGNTLYIADTTPVQDILAKGMLNITKLMTSPTSDSVWGEILGTEDMGNAESSVTTEQRQGREVKILTFKGRRFPGTMKRVLEIDAQTNRLLQAHEYYQPDGKEEYASAVLEEVQYNSPAPNSASQMPSAAKQEKASMEIEKGVDYLTFLMKQASGQQVGQLNLGIKTSDLVTQADREAAADRQAWIEKQMAEDAKVLASPVVKMNDAERKATSVYYLYEPTNALEQIRGKVRALGPTNRVALWMSDTAFYARGAAGPQGKTFPAWGIDAKHLKWVIWDGKKMYVADLKPIANDARIFVKQFRLLGWESYKEDFNFLGRVTNLLEGQKEAVSSRVISNRKVDIQTVINQYSDGITESILEIDAATKYLISDKMYSQKTGGEKRLLATVTAEYNAPAPAALADMLHYGKHPVPATVTIEEKNMRVELVMQAEGKVIDRLMALKF